MVDLAVGLFHREVGWAGRVQSLELRAVAYSRACHGSGYDFGWWGEFVSQDLVGYLPPYSGSDQSAGMKASVSCGTKTTVVGRMSDHDVVDLQYSYVDTLG